MDGDFELLFNEEMSWSDYGKLKWAVFESMRLISVVNEVKWKRNSVLCTALLRPCMCRNVAKYSTNCIRMNWEVIIIPKLKWIWSVILPDCMLNTWFYLFTENEVMPAPAGIAANQPSAPAKLEREVSPRPVSPRRSVARAENVDEMRAINEAYVQSKKSKSSLKKQHATTNRFMSWFRSRGKHRPLKDIPVESLDQMLSLWLINLRQASGTEYEPNSLQSYLSAIKCHLNELGIDIKKPDMTSKVVVANKKELKSLGKGNFPNQA